MAAFNLDSFSTALVLLPPPYIQTRVNLLRSANDKAYPRWTAHITLIYPFTTHLDALPCVRAKIEQAMLKPFPLILDAVGHFSSRDYVTVYLGQSPKLLAGAGAGVIGSGSQNNDAVHRLWAILATSLGYGGRPFVPHMTLGQTSHRRDDIHLLESKGSQLLRSGPVEWTVGSIAVLHKDETDGGRMKIIDEIFLASSDGMEKSIIAPDSPFSYHYGPAVAKWMPTLAPQVAHVSFKGLCVMTLNVLHDTQHPSPSRFTSILALLLDVDADIVCLQEVTDEFMSLLLHDNQIHSRWSWCTRGPDIPMESERNILVLSRDQLPFSWKRVPLGSRHKAATVLTLNVLQSEINVLIKTVVAVVHLTAGLMPRHLDIKAKEFLSLIQYLQQQHADDEWIIVGDMNLPTDCSLPPLVDTLVCDAWQTLHGTEALSIYSATYDPERNVLAAQTARDDRTPFRYDRIYMKRRSAMALQSIVLCNGPEGPMLPVSDHWPLYVRFSFPPHPPSTGATPSHGASAASSSAQYSSPVTSGSSQSLHLRGEVCTRAASDFDLLAFAQEAGTIPDTKHDERREAAVEALCKLINASREGGAEAGLAQKRLDESVGLSTVQSASSVKLVLIPVGSFAMNVHFPDSDIDCIVVGNIISATFWTTVQQKISRQITDANGTHDQVPVILKRFVKDAAVQMMVLCIGGFKFDVQYCPAAILAENWSKHMNSESMDDDVMLSVPSLRVLNAHRDRIHLQKAISSFALFQLAYRSIKLFCIRRGLYASRFGFLGGIHLTIMLRHIAERLPESTNAFELVKEFLQVYSSFDWASKVVSVSDVDVTYRRSAREPMVVLSPQRPTINVAANASFPTRQTIIKELCLAHGSLVRGMSWTQICGSEASSFAKFLDEYDNFVRIDVSYWGGSCTRARALLGYIESRVTHLLVDLHAADQHAVVRLWPERLTDLSQAMTDGGTSSVQGFYLLGLQHIQLEKSTTPLIGVLRAFEESVRKNASYFDASTCFFSVATCTRTHIMHCGNIWFDRPVWRDDGIDEPLSAEEDEGPGNGAASYWEEARGDPDRQEYVVNHSASKKQRRVVRDLKRAHHVPAERLRTSADVYNRLLWDPQYFGEDYLIGYEDRFLGIKEMPLKSWSREVDDETFIPFHRVVHFRCKSTGVVVWDRRAKVDRVFGSGVVASSS